MNINCSICSDLFVPSSAIYVTRCGHVFHYTCLVQWIERSKTCPQCRNKTNEKSIVRLFFNYVNSDGIEEDVVTLQSKLDSLNLQLRLKENHVKDADEKLKTVTNENSSLQNKNLELKADVDRYKSGIASLKDQINYFKDKSKYVDKLEQEIIQLKEKMRIREEATKALNGSLEEANDIINNSNCPKTLSVIAFNLKRELESMQRKKNKMFSTMKKTENELFSCRRDLNSVIEERNKLKNDLLSHEQCEAEIRILKDKIEEMMNHTQSVNPSLIRVATESPAPLLSTLKSKLHPKQVDSPTVVERIEQIKNSKSPYLKIKPNSVSSLIKQQEFISSVGTSSLFGKSLSTSSLVVSKSISEYSYDGLGGHSKDEKFPVPNVIKKGVKRTKSFNMSSNKFKKLAKPTRKLDDFLDMSNID